MKTWLCVLTLVILFFKPFVSQSADISGCVKKSGSLEPITHASVAFAFVDNWINLGDVDPITGCYNISGIAEGDYNLVIQPHLFSPDERYIVQRRAVTISTTGNSFDFTLEKGGNFTGTMTTEVPVINPETNHINVDVFDENGNYHSTGYVDWNNNGTYISAGLQPGLYYVRFTDHSGQFQSEMYDNLPGDNSLSNMWRAQKVSVSMDTTTPDINVSLHEAAESKNRYYITYSDVSTYHTSQNSPDSYSTFIGGYAEFERFSNGYPISSDEIASFAITGPSSQCTAKESDFYTDIYLRLRYRDIDDNGGVGDGLINRPDEVSEIVPNVTAGSNCNWGSSPHEAGQYQFTANFENGSGNDIPPLTHSLSLPRGLTWDELPPVTNLTANWNNSSNELSLSWKSPNYPNPSLLQNMQIRVYSYKNGQFNNTQFRVQNLPPTLSNFTLNSDMTTAFNHAKVDQIDVQIRVYGTNNTMARTRQSYDFDSKAGTLIPAEIRMKYFDINGDGKTGLEEAIHNLRILTGQ